MYDRRIAYNHLPACAGTAAGAKPSTTTTATTWWSSRISIIKKCSAVSAASTIPAASTISTATTRSRSIEAGSCRITDTCACPTTSATIRPESPASSGSQHFAAIVKVGVATVCL